MATDIVWSRALTAAATSFVIACTSTPPSRLATPHEPLVTDAIDIDYEALPRLEPVDLSSDTVAPTFAWRQGGYGVGGMGDLTSVIHVGDATLFDGPRPRGATGFLEQNFCAEPIDELETVRWASFRLADKTKESLAVFAFDGTVDALSCQTKPVHAFRAEAKALIPGVIYGYRSRGRLPDDLLGIDVRPLDELIPSETLVIIAPRTIWFASSSPDETRSLVLQSGFTELEIPIRVGAAVSVTLDLAVDDIAEFEGISERQVADDLLGGAYIDPPSANDAPVTTGPAPLRTVTIKLDFVWSADAGAPTTVAFISPLRGRKGDIAASSVPDLTQRSHYIAIDSLLRVLRRAAESTGRKWVQIVSDATRDQTSAPETQPLE
jgi:hypothetical protein